MRDPRVDAYIQKSAPFARPVLEHLRDLVHAACPGVQETMKWSFPYFEYKGNLCFMSSFKEHCAFGFWRGKEVLGEDAADGAMGHFGRITSIKDLPSRSVMVKHIRKAAALNEAGPAKRQASRPNKAATEAEVPPDISEAIAAEPAADATWRAFPPSHRREYVEWITEAKQPATRARRIATMVEWLREGKDRNWKYRR